MPFTCKNIKGERGELTLAWPMGKLGCDSDVRMHLERRDAINLQGWRSLGLGVLLRCGPRKGV